MLENVKCEIISMSRNGQVDAYVLSESSMFISQRRFILKTCGTTTPLECIRDLLGMAKLFAGFDSIEVRYVVTDNSKTEVMRALVWNSMLVFLDLLYLFTTIIKVRILLSSQDIFYSRKNFERPELQLKPHRSFEQEVALLDEMFADGAAYCLGTLNRYDTVKREKSDNIREIGILISEYNSNSKHFLNTLAFCDAIGILMMKFACALISEIVGTYTL